MAKIVLILGLLLSAFVVANTALADDSDLGKMSWALQDEILRWESLEPGTTHRAVELCVYTTIQVSPKQIEAIRETGAKVLGSMLNQVVIETSNPAVVRALTKLNFVGYMDFVVPFTSGPVPILPSTGTQTPWGGEEISIQNELQPNEALISYSFNDNILLIQVINCGHVYAPQSVGITKQNIINKIASLYATLQMPMGEKDVQKTLEDLYALLIQPVQSELEDKDTLIIIPDGPLWYVPFSALVIKDRLSTPQTFLQSSSYLIENYTISYLPSVEAAASLLGREPTHTTGGFLGIFSQGSHWYGKEIEQSLKRFGHLLVKHTDSVVITAAEVLTETDFKERAQSASFITLFAPSTFNYLELQKSYIAFLKSKEDDGMLQAQEVAGLKLPGVELVMLGAEEPLPKALRSGNMPSAGEQLASHKGAEAVLIWPQAFLSAGANTVIQPLWPANPATIDKLLTDMSEYHKNGDAWTIALAKAQRDLIRDTTFSDPWLWAPYQLIGRWR